MAVRKIYVSDVDQKTELNEDEVVTIRIMDGGGDTYSLDMTDEQFEKHFGKYLTEETRITRTAQEEFDAKLERSVRAKVESGELIRASDVRGQTRRQVKDTSSGRPPEALAAIRSWAKEQGIQVSDRGRVAQSIIDKYDQAKGGKLDASA